jgi:hypothetical protein
LSSGRIADNVTPHASAVYNYSGTITTTAPLTIGGDIYQANGMFNGVEGPVLVEGSLILDGGTFIAPTDGFQLVGSFEHTGGTYQQVQVVTGTADVGFPKAGGVVINANSQALESTAVIIRAGTDCTATSGETVRHCYDITPTNTSGVSATITFYFGGSEVVSDNVCSTLNVYHWHSSAWHALTLDASYGINGRNCSGGPQSVQVDNVSEFSPFVLKSDGAPTAVTLASFTATLQEGDVLIVWETAVEIDNVGFNLYRSTSPDGPYLRLNQSLIPSRMPGSIFGAVYTWLDENALPGTVYYYRLEDIGVKGQRTHHGPLEVQSVSTTVLALKSIDTYNPPGIWIAVGLVVSLVATVSLWQMRRR